VLLGTRSFPVLGLVTATICAVAGAARRLATAPVERLLFTVPASYAHRDVRRELMLQAGQRAGFAVVELLPEPVAAGSPRPSGTAPGPAASSRTSAAVDTAVLRATTAGHDVLGHDALQRRRRT
jgi:hypothetical protein